MLNLRKKGRAGPKAPPSPAGLDPPFEDIDVGLEGRDVGGQFGLDARIPEHVRRLAHDRGATAGADGEVDGCTDDLVDPAVRDGGRVSLAEDGEHGGEGGPVDGGALGGREAGEDFGETGDS